MEVLTAEEGQIALELARNTLEHRIGKQPEKEIHLTPIFSEKRGVFVTLKEGGELRGCIGFPYPTTALGDAIREAAFAAAIEDPRFPPVVRSEIPNLAIEVTVLTPPVRLECDPGKRPEHIEVGKHGLIIRGRGTSGLLLPQVPVEWKWTCEEFLDHTCAKAGLPRKSWQSGSCDLYTFEGQIFTESGESPVKTC